MVMVDQWVIAITFENSWGNKWLGSMGYFTYLLKGYIYWAYNPIDPDH